MKLETMAAEVAKHLVSRNERLVLAESCTCGLIASTFGKIAGISESFCGSAVVYRADSKRRWLGVSNRTIKQQSTESKEVAVEMALGVLKLSPEADWSAAVVGHVGPNAPEETDGCIFICLARRTKKGRIKVKELKEYKLASKNRLKRQEESGEATLTHLVRLLNQKTEKEGHKNK